MYRSATASEIPWWLAERVLEHREASIPLKQQAVLFRASHHSAPLEIELTRRNVPFVKFGGLKFLETAHIIDAALKAVPTKPTPTPAQRRKSFRVIHGDLFD